MMQKVRRWSDRLSCQLPLSAGKIRDRPRVRRSRNSVRTSRSNRAPSTEPGCPSVAGWGHRPTPAWPSTPSDGSLSH